MFALALDQQVVGHLHTLPTLVAVHRVITAYDRGHDARRSFPHVLFQPFDESLAAVRIGIAAVHKAMHVGTFDTVFIGDVRQFEQVIQRRVHPAVRNQSHQVHAHPVRFGVFERLHDFGILQNRIVAAGPVDLHQILIDHPPRTDIEVPHLRIAHLPIGQADVFAVRTQLRMRVFTGHFRNIGRMHLCDDIPLLSVADAPTVEDHQQYFAITHPNITLLVPQSVLRPCR